MSDAVDDNAVGACQQGDKGAYAILVERHYRRALYHLLLTQTSCYRYWGQGLWADYGRELCRRTIDILNRDF